MNLESALIFPQIFAKQSDFIRAEFYGKPLNFLENESDEIVDFQKLEFENSTAFCDQVHGDKILHVDKPGKYIGYDGLITQTPNLPLLIKTADCIGAIFFDPVTKTIAAIHAGWRGLAKNILPKCIQEMKSMGADEKHILVALSPSIHTPQFSDPKRETPSFFHPFIASDNTVDLWRIAEWQLLEHGILEQNLEKSPLCTYTDPSQQWWSHRRGEEGRNASIVYLRET